MFCGNSLREGAVNYFRKALHLDVWQGSEYASVQVSCTDSKIVVSLRIVRKSKEVAKVFKGTEFFYN